MLIIHGVYHWRPRPVAFRNDYCISCRRECVAICVRTIDVWHVFWIPVVPVGVFRRWWCQACGNRPDLSRTARRSIKVLLAVVLTLLTAPLWFLAVQSEKRSDEGFTWLVIVVLSVLAVAAWWWVSRGSDDVERRSHLARIPPSRETECPMCGISLQLTEPARCIRCGIVRTRLE
jgi:hypothetical protein